MEIQVLMGIGTKLGQWLMSPENSGHDMWHPTRKDALSDAAQYASDHGKAVKIVADSE